MVGFAAGVMTAISAFGLIIPAMAASGHLGRWAFLPAFAGFWAGVLGMLWLDRISGRALRRLAKAAAVLLPLAACAPWLSGVSAGAMVYLVVRDLVPAMGEADRGTVLFGAGFTAAMVFLCR